VTNSDFVTNKDPKLPQAWQVNGLWQANVPVNDRGLAYGDGLFETLLMRRGRCPLLDFHLARIAAGCERLAIPLTRTEIQQDYEQFHHAIDQQQLGVEGIIKLIISRGSGGRGYAVKDPLSPTIIWQLLPLVHFESEAANGVALQLSAVRLGRQPRLAGLKHLNRLEYVLAAQNVEPGYLPLLLDQENWVIETLSHNLFFCRDGILFTPLLQFCGVDGVLRQVTRQHLAPALGLTWQEENITLNDLLTAEEVFVGNSVQGFWPVTQLSHSGDPRCWSVGPVCKQLQLSHQQFLQRT
jgi:4-amino-4-deoxychorismate lyase